MAGTIAMTLVARYEPWGGYTAYVRHRHGDDRYVGYTGQGASPDEARGHLLREMILAGLDEEAVFLDIETEENDG